MRKPGREGRSMHAQDAQIRTGRLTKQEVVERALEAQHCNTSKSPIPMASIRLQPEHAATDMPSLTCENEHP